MKYLVNIESLDYVRQRNLEQKYKTVLIENQDEKSEYWVVLDNEDQAKKMEETIKAFNELFKLTEEKI